MSQKLAFVVLAVAATLGWPHTAAASAITFVESTYGLNFGCGTTPTACQAVDGFSNPGAFSRVTTTGTGLLSFNQSFTVGSNTVAYIAAAQSSYGSLHASATASFDRTATDSRGVYASSLFRELLTVNSAALNNQPGTLTMTFALDGTISESGDGNAFSYVILGAGSVTNPEEYGEQAFSFESSFNGSVSLTVPIVYGREFLLTAGLGAFAGGVQLCPSCVIGVAPVLTTGKGTDSALFFNTLVLTGLTPATSTNPFVTGAQFVSGSGTTYSTNGIVPEPGSFVLLGTGLALGVLRWRRRITSRSAGS